MRVPIYSFVSDGILTRFVIDVDGRVFIAMPNGIKPEWRRKAKAADAFRRVGREDFVDLVWSAALLGPGRGESIPPLARRLAARIADLASRVIVPTD